MLRPASRTTRRAKSLGSRPTPSSMGLGPSWGLGPQALGLGF
eukprot:gene14195-21552_t